MSWNYRVVKHTDKGEEWYGIHEVYYDKKDKPDMISEDPIDAHGMTPDELKSDLDMMRQAFDKPVVVYEDFLKEIMGEFKEFHGDFWVGEKPTNKGVLYDPEAEGIAKGRPCATD
jgi:hypothetical protein